jgi:hypothetical protein
MSGEIKGAPAQAPGSVLHREISEASDGVSAITEKAWGINMSGERFANIEVVALAGANPAVEIQFWSEEAGAFVSEHTPLSLAAKGANVDWGTTVECRGRLMFVKIPTGVGAGQTAKVFVGGFSSYRR